MNKERKKHTKVQETNKISRKEAMKKLGYSAFSAATMLILLNKPDKSQAQPTSDDLPPGGDWEW